MIRWKQSLTVVLTMTFLAGLGSLHQAQAAKKGSAAGDAVKPKAGKISSDPDSATVKEAALLKWGPVKPPLRGKNYEFFVRGIFLESSKVEGKKELYKFTVLPIEVVENNQRFINHENYQTGIEVYRDLSKQELKALKKGNVVEVKQWYETIDEGGIGHAKMVGYIFHQEVMPYPTSAAAFVKKVGIEPEEQLNALRALEMYNGGVASEAGLKEALDVLATSGKGEVKEKATQLFANLYNSQPTGKCKIAKDTQTYSCK